MLGPAVLAPLLAVGLSARPAAEYTPSGAVLIFVGLGSGIGALALASSLGLPRQLTNQPAAVELASAVDAFAPLEEEAYVEPSPSGRPALTTPAAALALPPAGAARAPAAAALAPLPVAHEGLQRV